MLELCRFYLFWIWLCYANFLCVKLFLCFFKKHKKKLELCRFCLIFLKFYVVKNTSSNIFLKNIEKVWDIEKVCNIAKFRQGKNARDPTFFYVKFFRWTGLTFPILFRSWCSLYQLKFVINFAKIQNKIST